MNTKLFIAIAVFLVLAVFGAAVFSGFMKDRGLTSAEQTQSAHDDSTINSTQQAENDDGTTAPAEQETAAEQSAPANSADAGHPFDLSAAMSARSLGNPNAPIRIVEYASLTCNHCAHFHNDILPELKAKYIDTGKVYLEFREFPLNAPALDASLLARCLPQEQYQSFTSLLFKTQEDWTTRPDYISALKQNAKLAGLSDQGIEQCLQSNELRQAIGQSIQHASTQYKISSTPTFVINDGEEYVRGAMPVVEFEKIFTKLSGGTVSETPAAPDAETPAAGDDAAAPAVEEPAAESAPAEQPIEQ